MTNSDGEDPIMFRFASDQYVSRQNQVALFLLVLVIFAEDHQLLINFARPRNYAYSYLNYAFMQREGRLTVVYTIFYEIKENAIDVHVDYLGIRKSVTKSL